MVEFVSYTGEYPALCCGTLTLKIDNEIMTFGLEGEFFSFWESGGMVYFDEDWNGIVETYKWELDENSLPDKLKPYAQEMIDVFNKNVPWGCCGGCL